MLDLARIRNNPQEVVDALAKKGYNADFTEIIKWDDERKATITEIEQLKAQKNKVSAQIPVLKKAGQPVEPIFDEMRKLGDEIAAGDAKINDLIAKINDALACMPNIPDPDLLPGEKENNKVIKIVGEQPKFDFPLKNHVDICTDLGMIDYERGVKLSGNGFGFTEAWAQDWNGRCSTTSWTNILKTATNLFFRRINSATTAASAQVNSPNSATRCIGSTATRTENAIALCFRLRKPRSSICMRAKLSTKANFR